MKGCFFSRWMDFSLPDRDRGRPKRPSSVQAPPGRQQEAATQPAKVGQLELELKLPAPKTQYPR